MKKQYHILNGDVLKEQFPEDIQGEIIVARECLVDGDVNGNNLAELFGTRAAFISENYEGYTALDYFEKTVPEFEKIQSISDGAGVNLWFEDDLFCQVNFWFVIHLLVQSNKQNSIFLIRPKTHNQFGFGGLSEADLGRAYKNRLLLAKLDELSKLWSFYQNNDIENLLNTAQSVKELYPFILAAVQAHIDRIPTNESLGRPAESLLQIMTELQTKDFGTVFKEFNKRESIYGFGDLQVKRLFDEIQNKQ